MPTYAAWLFRKKGVKSFLPLWTHLDLYEWWIQRGTAGASLGVSWRDKLSDWLPWKRKQTILSLWILNHSAFIYIAPLKPQHVENTTVQWKSAGDEFTFYKESVCVCVWVCGGVCVWVCVGGGGNLRPCTYTHTHSFNEISFYISNAFKAKAQLCIVVHMLYTSRRVTQTHCCNPVCSVLCWLKYHLTYNNKKAEMYDALCHHRLEESLVISLTQRLPHYST